MQEGEKTTTLANFSNIQEFQTSKGTALDQVTGIITFTNEPSNTISSAKATSSQDTLPDSLMTTNTFSSNDIDQVFTALNSDNHSSAYSLMTMGAGTLPTSEPDLLTLAANNIF